MCRAIAISAALCLLALTNVSVACQHCDASPAVRCQICECECCPCQLVQKTIMEPMCVTETRMKVQIVKTAKEREETYTVFKKVPEKRTYSKECCYLETEVKSKEITKEQCRRVQNPVIFEDMVKVPVTEIREGVRRREVCTRCGKVCIEEPCSCQVTTTQDVPRVQNCERQDVVFEECKKTIDYCVKTPKFEKIDCGVETVYKLVPVEKKRTVQVCVPEAVKVPVEVKVQRMVAKDICCCQRCWCAMQEQAARDKKKAAHKEKLAAAAAKLPNPVECSKKVVVGTAKAAVAVPMKVAKCVGGAVKALNPLK